MKGKVRCLAAVGMALLLAGCGTVAEAAGTSGTAVSRTEASGTAKKIRILVDILMTVLFLAAMGYHITDNWLHEWIGASLIFLFFVHNILNIGWYRAIPKGKYTAIRRIQTVLNLLLLLSMAGAMVSGMMLSRNVFAFLNLKAGSFGRRLHMISTAWAFPLMAAHLGMHWGMVTASVRKKLPEQWERAWKLGTRGITGLLAVYGIYAAISRRIWNEMFLLVEFTFFDYEEPAALFFADYAAILVLFATIAYYGKAGLLRKTSGTKKRKLEQGMVSKQ